MSSIVDDRFQRIDAIAAGTYFVWGASNVLYQKRSDAPVGHFIGQRVSDGTPSYDTTQGSDTVCVVDVTAHINP